MVEHIIDIPDEYVKPKKKQKKKPTQKELRKTREKQRIKSFLKTTCVAVFLVVYLLQYVSLQSSITTELKNIGRLQQQIERLKTNNSMLENRIMIASDLRTVKKEALALGLQVPTEEQICYYRFKPEDTMRVE